MFADLSLFESLSDTSSAVSVFNTGGQNVVIRRKIVRNDSWGYPAGVNGGGSFAADKVRRRPGGIQSDQNWLRSDQRGDTFKTYYRSLKNLPFQEAYTTLRWLYSVGEYVLADKLAQKLVSRGADLSSMRQQQATPAQSSAPKSRGVVRRFFRR